MRSIWRFIDNSTRTRPMLTKAVLGGILTLISDTVVQKFIEEKEEMDVERSAAMLSWRVFIHTPIVHHWFNFAEKAFGSGTGWRTVLIKIAADQLLASPAVHFMFLPYMTMMEGGSVDDAKAKLEHSYVKMMTMSYMFWPFVHFLTFGVVPLRHRVLFVNTAAMFWSGTLSYLNSQTRSAIPDTTTQKTILA